MNNSLSLPSSDDLDTKLRLVARNIAQGLYELPRILEMCDCTFQQFNKFKSHPVFLEYVKQEKEAWNKASSFAERTKLKAGIAIEEWIPEAYTEMKNTKQGLNHRVELAKLLAKLAGFDNATPLGGTGGGGGGFSLQINIAPGHSTTFNATARVIEEEAIPDEAPQPQGQRFRILQPREPVEEVDTSILDDLIEDEYDPFTSPDTIGDL